MTFLPAYDSLQRTTQGSRENNRIHWTTADNGHPTMVTREGPTPTRTRLSTPRLSPHCHRGQCCADGRRSPTTVRSTRAAPATITFSAQSDPSSADTAAVVPLRLQLHQRRSLGSDLRPAPSDRPPRLPAGSTTTASYPSGQGKDHRQGQRLYTRTTTVVNVTNVAPTVARWQSPSIRSRTSRPQPHPSQIRASTTRTLQRLTGTSAERASPCPDSGPRVRNRHRKDHDWRGMLPHR